MRHPARALVLIAAAAVFNQVPGTSFAASTLVGEITVEAGAQARRDTVVSFPVPRELAGRALVLKGPGVPRVALDVEPAAGSAAESTAVFILPKLAKGKRVRLSIIEDEPATNMPREISFTEMNDALGVSIAGAPVLRYQMKARPPREGLSPQAIRGGYIHPVFTPSGAIVTDDYALKHAAHHGIWTAWQSSELEGRKLSFWGSQSARLDFDKLVDSRGGRVVGGFTARHKGVDLTAKPARQVLDEEWKVRVYRTHEKDAPYYLFDLDWTDAVVGNAPLKVLEYRYGGLAVRGHAEWDGPTGATFLTSEGKDRLAGEGSTARWVHLGGPVGGKPVGIAALVHPQNFRAPQPVRLHHNEPYFSVAPAKAGPFTIEPGKPLLSRYRFVVADGPADKALLERLWQDYAQPPTVTLKLRKPLAAATRASAPSAPR